MAFDWIAGLFQSEQTRGLSGDSASAVALDDSNPYYNYRLRRHKAEGDIVADPSLLWYTSPYVKRRTGLGTHIAAEQGEGVANFTDVLLILSKEDYSSAGDGAVEPWIEKASRALSQEFENFCRREQFSRLYSHRQLGFRILCDTSTEMGGQSLGLSAGEFVTGLLPNLYTGPVRGSHPVIGVHLNLPGVFDGYQEIGRLYNDQILFTIGNHWLDNFAHPSLQEAALYRLQQYPDGSFVHIVNPDLQDRYQVTSVQQGGTNVLTLATRDGQPLAYMVLAVIDPPDETSDPEPVPTGSGSKAKSKPGIAMPVAPSKADETPDVAPPMLIDDALQPVKNERRSMGSKTIIPDAPRERIFTFQERGALLQKVHFSAFMEGYDVFLGRRGELGTVVENPAATFQVRKRQVSLKAHIELMVGGRKVPAGSELMIEGDTTIEVGTERLDYRDLRGLRVDGWPYVGEIRRPASSNYMIWGDKYRIGRSRECRVVLPDEPRNDNIHWKASVGDGATIRARTGEIPKSRFYTDSIMVASEHSTIDVRGDKPDIICNARHCYVYVRRHSEVMPLYPSTSGRTPQQMDLEPGDELLIGNCLFHVGYSPLQDAPMVLPSAPAPEVKLSPDSLVDAVSAPDFADLEAKSDPGEEDTSSSPPGIPPDEPSEMAFEDEVKTGLLRPIDIPVNAAPIDSVTGADDPDDDSDNEGVLRPIGEIDGGPTGVARLTASMANLEDVVDEPTSPGMSVPRSLLDEDKDADEVPPDSLFNTPPEDDVAPEPEVDPEKDQVEGWEEDEWDEATGPPSVPAESGTDGPVDVPKPFPEVEDAPNQRATWNPDQEPPPSPDITGEISEDDEPPTVMDATQLAAEAVRDADADADAEADAEVEADPEAEPDAVPTQQVDLKNLDQAPAPSTSELDAEPTEMAHPPEAPPDSPPPPPGADGVVCTDDGNAQFELGRPLHIVQSGWTVRGEVTAGNHVGADMVIPENRVVSGQRFTAVDYFKLKVRGKKGHLDVLAAGELLIDEDDPKEDRYADLAAITIDVIRRDDQGEEDFVVRLVIGQDRSLPDPRAGFVALDYEDPLAAALVTRGLGVNQPRNLVMGDISMNLTWDGEKVTVTDYLESYQTADGFLPFFVQTGGKRFVTAPEDGGEIVLLPGDRFVVGNAVYLVRGLS